MSLDPQSATPSKPWPWEGSVQQIFANVLTGAGWTVDAVADTKLKQRGIDIVASRGTRRLGIEVKGYPSVGYEDPARAGETKRARPTGQAKKWFANGILAALQLRQDQPNWDSLLVLPNFPRYQVLLATAAMPLSAAGVHVVLLSPDGGFQCETWSAV